MATRTDLQKINQRKTSHGSTAFFARGGEMATRKGGMAAFEKSKFDKEPPGVKEGSKKDMALDKKQMKAAGFAKGGGIESKGKTKGKMIAMKRGGKC